MRKTSLYLSDEDAGRLNRIARREGRPQAEVVRDALRAYRPRVEPDRSFALDGCVRGDGTSIADLDEDELLDGFGT